MCLLSLMYEPCLNRPAFVRVRLVDCPRLGNAIWKSFADSNKIGVVEHIQEKWGIIAQSDCVPVHIALQLMDCSSLGRGNDYEDFRQTSRALQKALKAIVNGTTAGRCRDSCTNVYRTSSGLQQLHWHLPQDTVQHSNRSKSYTKSQRRPDAREDELDSHKA